MVVVQLKGKRAYVSEMTVRSFRLILRTFPDIVNKDFDPILTFIRSKDEIDHIAQQFITIKTNRQERVKKLSSLNNQELMQVYQAFMSVNPDMFKGSVSKASPTSSEPMSKIDTGIDGDAVLNLDVSILTLSRLGYEDVMSMPYSLMTQAMIHAKKK